MLLLSLMKIKGDFQMIHVLNLVLLGGTFFLALCQSEVVTSTKAKQFKQDSARRAFVKLVYNFISLHTQWCLQRSTVKVTWII